MEATGIFMTMSNLWQSDDPVLRRLVYLVIKEMSSSISNISIVTNSLIKVAFYDDDIFKQSRRKATISLKCEVIDLQNYTLGKKNFRK